MNCYKPNCKQTDLLKTCSHCGGMACCFHRIPNKVADSFVCEDCFANKGTMFQKEQNQVPASDLFNEYPEIIFTENWNGKLDSKRFFITVRLHQPDKFVVGSVYKIREVKKDNSGQIIEDKREPFLARLTSEAVFPIEKLPTQTASLDTGYTKDESIEIIKKMYKENVMKPFASYLLDKKVSVK